MNHSLHVCTVTSPWAIPTNHIKTISTAYRLLGPYSLYHYPTHCITVLDKHIFLSANGHRKTSVLMNHSLHVTSPWAIPTKNSECITKEKADSTLVTIDWATNYMHHPGCPALHHFIAHRWERGLKRWRSEGSCTWEITECCHLHGSVLACLRGSINCIIPGAEHCIIS